MVAVFGLVAGRRGAVHVCGITLGRVIRNGMLGLDVVVLADADADTLVGEAP
jgi:hypothetical protein